MKQVCIYMKQKTPKANFPVLCHLPVIVPCDPQLSEFVSDRHLTSDWNENP